MRHLPYLLLACLYFTVYSCSEATSHDKEVLTPKRMHRGIYIDDFDKILGNPHEEQKLLQWCNKHSFNEIATYGMERILAEKSRYAELADFLSLARDSYKNLKIVFVAGGIKCVQKIADYSHFHPHQIPDGIVTEYEFWNKDFPYPEFIGMLREMDNYRKSQKQQGKKVKRIVYVSHFREYEEKITTAEILNTLLLQTDELWLVNYAPKAYEYPTPLHEKLQTLANAASKNNMTAHINILYNVMENAFDPNIFHYVALWKGNHSFEQVYSQFLSGFNSQELLHKKNLKITGYQFFRYSDAARARP